MTMTMTMTTRWPGSVGWEPRSSTCCCSVGRSACSMRASNDGANRSWQHGWRFRLHWSPDSFSRQPSNKLAVVYPRNPYVTPLYISFARSFYFTHRTMIEFQQSNFVRVSLNQILVYSWIRKPGLINEWNLYSFNVWFVVHADISSKLIYITGKQKFMHQKHSIGCSYDVIH